MIYSYTSPEGDKDVLTQNNLSLVCMQIKC